MAALEIIRMGNGRLANPLEYAKSLKERYDLGFEDRVEVVIMAGNLLREKYFRREIDTSNDLELVKRIKKRKIMTQDAITDKLLRTRARIVKIIYGGKLE